MNNLNQNQQRFIEPLEVFRTKNDTYSSTNKKLGKGGEGIVFVYVRKSDHVAYAVKIIPNTKIQKNGSLTSTKKKMPKKMAPTLVPNELLHNELYISQRLSKKNGSKYFTQLIDHYQGRYDTYLVFNYCRGGSLYKHIKEIHRVNRLVNPIDEKHIKYLFWQIVSAVRVLHRQNIIHRDLKPQNILFKTLNKEKLVIGDFGTAIYNIGPKPNHNSGTLQYIAPEVAQGHNWGYPVDWWACGIILFELLSGRRPFRSRNKFDIPHKIVNNKLRFRSKIWCAISDEARYLVMGLLNKDPHERFGYKEIRNHKWMESILQQSPKRNKKHTNEKFI